jgi:hypothetical protein
VAPSSRLVGVVTALSAVPAVEPRVAADEGGVGLDGDDGRATVVHALREHGAVPDHVARRPWVAT